MIRAALDALETLYTGRASGWPALRRRWLKEHPACAACGATKGVEVHHIFPVHAFPDVELSDVNLLSLCRVHHFWIGHLGAWTSWNTGATTDARSMLAKIQSRPYKPLPVALAHWFKA